MPREGSSLPKTNTKRNYMDATKPSMLKFHLKTEALRFHKGLDDVGETEY